jgi:plastocyanin
MGIDDYGRESSMLRIIVLIGTVVALAVGVASQAHGQGASIPTLRGTVGPGFTITLTKSGRRVRTLRAGTYMLRVNDRAAIHNFTLERETKPKIEKHVTSTSFTGTKSIRVTLRKGEWKFYCSVHEATMNGTFMVR